jgi:hypothetical protein
MGNGGFAVDRTGERGFDDDVGRAVLDDFLIAGIRISPWQPSERSAARHREDSSQVDAVCLDERAKRQVGDGDDPQIEAKRGESLGFIPDKFGQGAIDAAKADESKTVRGH